MNLFFAALLILGPIWARASDSTTCGAVDSGPHPYHYCITESSGSTNDEVLYAFPGAGGSGEANWWTTGSIPAAIKSNWEGRQASPPRVIEVSFGPLWILVPQNSHFRSGLLEYFFHQIIPDLEKKLKKPAARRRIVGHSMGGLNSAIAGLLHPDLFTSVAMLSPALVGLSPFAGRPDIEAYAGSHGIPADAMGNLLGIARGVVNTDEEWREFYPTVLLAQKQKFAAPEFLVSAGTKDIRFYEEARRFAGELLRAENLVTWAPYDGGHTDVDAQTVAKFLVPGTGH